MTFKLSDKKLKEYSNTDLFVFNSLDRERDFAVKMINYNKNLKVIDVSMGMNYDNNIAELWLNPYNYLMMTQNTKNGLLEYISNPYLISNDEGTGIENKYEELKYNISRLDADMKEAISLAPYKTVVVDSNLFKYLEKYSLNVISLEEDDKLNENTII
jgi:ABC-type Zn uptake system ZnuABC Zn-binding protein ZnuA